MKERTNRRNVTLTITLALLMVALFSTTACSKKAEPKEEVKASTEKVAETIVEDKEEVVTPETVVEPETEVEGPKSVGEWAQTVDVTEPKMTIWNDTLKEGIVLENGQKYVLREGDLLVICTKEKENGIEIDSDISLADFKSRTSSKYVQFQFNKEFSEETLFEVKITVAGTVYPFSVTLISENATTALDDSESSTEMSGKEWALSLEYEEAKLVVWNDETGTREVIENGGQYKMQEGDTLAVYYPTGYIISNVTPYDFVESLAMTSKLGIFNYTLPAESQDIDLEVEVLDSADVDSVFNYVITTP